MKNDESKKKSNDESKKKSNCVPLIIIGLDGL